MIRGLYTAASGMLLGLRQQDVVADNMANSSTIGYKAEQASQVAFGNVLLNWSDVPNATFYEVYLGLDGDPTSLYETTTSSQLSIEVEPGRTVQWKVGAGADACTTQYPSYFFFTTSLGRATTLSLLAGALVLAGLLFDPNDHKDRLQAAVDAVRPDFARAADLGVTIETGSNIQDNTVLRSSEHPVKIGKDCTIGHNVLLHDCVIGARVLVGMGSTLAPGTIIKNNVLVAAGSSTVRGQVLDSGWLWAGRPARPISRLDERRSRLIQQSAAIYREYAFKFAVNQAAALRAMAERKTVPTNVSY